MRYEAPQFELPLPEVEQRVEQMDFECPSTELPDLLHRLQVEGWTVTAVAVLPCRIGYRATAQRKVKQ